MLGKENISFILSIISIITAVITAWKNLWLSRAKIQIIQTDNGARSSFIQTFDGCCIVYGDGVPLPGTEDPPIISVLLIEVIITNKSSLPISILEFKTSDFTSNPFTSYSYTKNSFEITSEDRVSKLGSEKYPLKYLKPEFTIAPYTSERGYIMFWSGTEVTDFKTPGKIKLVTTTSRKKFNTCLTIPVTHSSEKSFVIFEKDENGEIKKTYSKFV
ncbi:hypothetical protein M4I17_09815 [Enterococcus thailandicus]|uniref:hypothetical protein n=2 Tax=Enterococcus thailandicus TaxID=417368 RepID=UPI002543B0EA|nr:hypothetical protein [Enterococcus thailandicus]MDK4352694.1 hypothetical protein [Enterococcus thailandicus]